MTKDEKFEQKLFDVATRHCSGIKYYRGLKRCDLIAVDDYDTVVVDVSDLREMLIDMHERSFEEGYNMKKSMELDMLYRLYETIMHYYQGRDDFTIEEIKDLNEQIQALFTEMRNFAFKENIAEQERSNERFEKITGRETA